MATATGATTPPPDRVAGAGRLIRFDRVERVVHWSCAVLFGVLILTGAALLFSPVGGLIGRRALIEDIHLYCGLALPFPLAVGLTGRWGKNLREDLCRLNRWTKADREWLSSLFAPPAGTRPDLRPPAGPENQQGKFNAGQKLNAAFVAGAGLVLLGTGVIMYWYHPWPLSWRTGATFVHDWLAFFFTLVAVGHIWMALRHPAALRAMLKGDVPEAWAAMHAPAWFPEAERTPSFGVAPSAQPLDRRVKRPRPRA